MTSCKTLWYGDYDICRNRSKLISDEIKSGLTYVKQRIARSVNSDEIGNMTSLSSASFWKFLSTYAALPKFLSVPNFSNFCLFQIMSALAGNSNCCTPLIKI